METVIISTNSFYLSTQAELAARGLTDESIAPHGDELIDRELERYYGLINGAREHLHGLFDSSERRALIEAGSGTVFNTPVSIDHFPEEVMYVVEHDLWVREHVDPNALMTKLDTLSRVARFALVDAVERHWLAMKQHGRAHLDDLFAPAMPHPSSPSSSLRH